jgi:ABC-type sugar transport system ATPase subunit
MMDSNQKAAVASPILALENIGVRFGDVTALHDETLCVAPGEIVGLLGHNGAGKSTFINVAAGAIRPQRGSVTIDGRRVEIFGVPREVERVGIRVIHQEPALVESLSVADNISLGRLEERRRPAARKRHARRALQLLGSVMNVDRLVSSLDFGERRVVDLARALSSDVRVLFLDEPTGALGEQETDRLHNLLRELARQGKGVVYVSHSLRGALAVCTRLVVLRGGRVIMNEPAETYNLTRLSEALAPGRRTTKSASGRAKAKIVLEVRQNQQMLQFPRGQIVGLFGIAGGPQFNLTERLFGVGEPIQAKLEGELYAPSGPRNAIAHGVYYVSADRERDGLLGHMSAVENLVLPWIARHTWARGYSRAKAAVVFDEMKVRLNIIGGSMDRPVSALSGGNRQKIVLGRWMCGDRPKVLLLSHPTQGIDVKARSEIAKALHGLASQGVTVLVSSSEADEIELVCDAAYTCLGDYWPRSEAASNWAGFLLQSLVDMAAKNSEARV